MRPPERLETERLILRKPVLKDAAAMFEAYATDPLVTRFLMFAPHRSIADTRSFVRRCTAVWRRGAAFPFAITRRATGELLGMIELRPETDFKAEVGYVLARPFWGNGYMPEALGAVAHWILAQPGVARIGAFCDVENVQSARTLEKAGFDREGLLRNWTIHPNRSEEPRDVYCYSKVAPVSTPRTDTRQNA